MARDLVDETSLEKELFFESLRPHKFRKDTLEVEFELGITLNVANVYRANIYRDPRFTLVKP